MLKPEAGTTAKPVPETITERVIVTATAYCAHCSRMIRRPGNEAVWLHIGSQSEQCAASFD